MYVAPIGLLSFAATVVDTGSQLASAYLQVFWVYGRGFAALLWRWFFVLCVSGGGWESVRRLWSQMLRPSLTALGTCSSMATMPVNLEASRDMGIPKDVCDVVIPVGAVLHKERIGDWGRAQRCCSALESAFIFRLRQGGLLIA